MGKQWKQWQTLFFWRSKITADGDFNHEIKSFSSPWNESYDQPNSILKSRDYLANKVPSSQSYGVSSSHVWMWELDHKESWVLKNWCFELWCWIKLLRVPWTARRSNQSILKEISPGCSLEGLMLKLKLQYFGHLTWRADSLEKTLMMRKIEGRRRRVNRGWDGWMASLTQWTRVWVNYGSWWWTGNPGLLQCMGSQIVRHYWATELNWTDIIYMNLLKNISTKRYSLKIICTIRLSVCNFNLIPYLILSARQWVSWALYQCHT